MDVAMTNVSLTLSDGYHYRIEEGPAQVRGSFPCVRTSERSEPGAGAKWFPLRATHWGKVTAWRWRRLCGRRCAGIVFFLLFSPWSVPQRGRSIITNAFCGCATSKGQLLVVSNS